MNSGLEKWRPGTVSNDGRKIDAALARFGQAAGNASAMPLETSAVAGRLIVALDLTASREARLAQARIATAQMFEAVKTIGAVAVKMLYYRGTNECRASQWHNDPAALIESMHALSCESGETQIARVLRMVLAEEQKVPCVVLVLDHCEEHHRELVELSQELGAKGKALLIFHECGDQDERSLKAKPLFKKMAEESRGQYVEFKPDSGEVLQEMLTTVAAFSARGAVGVKQVAAVKTAEARQLQTRLLLGPAKG